MLSIQNISRPSLGVTLVTFHITVKTLKIIMQELKS